jgi:hypothetical protein
MITVKATREGLLGGKTSTGYLVDAVVPFVALPSAAALRQWVRVRNPANGQSIRALVLDVGPWNINDNAYVFGGARPAAERGLSVSHTGHTNGAGIDLGEAVWTALGLTDNADVEWEFD